MSFSFHFCSFLYSGVCSDQLKLSIYLSINDIIVVQNSSNGYVLFLGCVFLDKYIATDLVQDRLKTLSITIV